MDGPRLCVCNDSRRLGAMLSNRIAESITSAADHIYTFYAVYSVPLPNPSGQRLLLWIRFWERFSLGRDAIGWLSKVNTRAGSIGIHYQLTIEIDGFIYQRVTNGI
jgi:hypothetical protein